MDLYLGCWDMWLDLTYGTQDLGLGAYTTCNTANPSLTTRDVYPNSNALKSWAPIVTACLRVCWIT
jgi:hypothetical protein